MGLRVNGWYLGRLCADAELGRFGKESCKLGWDWGSRAQPRGSGSGPGLRTVWVSSPHPTATSCLLQRSGTRRSLHSSPPCPAAGAAYEDAFRKSVEEPQQFWSECAQQIDWFKPWQKTLDYSNPPFVRWFVDGELNVCYNALDRHVENGRGDQNAIIYDSPVTKTVQSITYREALEQVSRLAGVLVKHGVQKGDRVVIYMPMIPQAMYTMLACARIGATHSLIFGGFASKELSTRVDHAKPKLIVTASFGIEPKRRIEYIPLLEKALEIAEHKPDKVIIYNRHGMEKVHLTSGCELDWDEEISAAKCHDCVPVSSDHPLYILYTSGTTGMPKGIVRTSGGYAVMLNWTMSNVYGLKPGEVWWAASDLGWVVGHSYICYAPLLHGNTSILYEGKPVGTPDAGAYFRLLSDHGVVALFTAPTALRVIRQQDSEAMLGRQYHFPRFRTLFVAGEHCDPNTLKWAKQVFNVPVLDHWWQTETGSPISASCVGLGNSLNPPPGQAGRPVPGYNAVILGKDAKEVNRNKLGNIAVKLPLPPGSLSTLWENEKLFKEIYFTKYPGYYDTMDAGYMDNDGYVYVMSRMDDVINVAGHRISAGAIEESIITHPAIADCAVVGFEDPVKGHVPLALCVLKNGITEPFEKLTEDIVKIVRDSIGPVAALRQTVFVPELPKTRSGKIPRSALSAVVNGMPFSITPTIEDPRVFSKIEAILKQQKVIS